MVLDPNLFKESVPFIKLLYDKEIQKSPQHEVITSISLVSYVPIVAVALWVKHLYGSTPELDAKIPELIQFYKYDSVLDIRDEK